MKKSEVLAHFGTQAKVGDVLKISQAAVSKWPEMVPEKQALKLSHITNGVLAYDPAVYRANDSEPRKEELSAEEAA